MCFMNELVKATKFQQALVWVVSLVLLSGCGSGGEDTSGPSDSTSPVLSSVQVSNITPTSAAITFNSDEQAAAVVDYADEAYYSANSTYNLSESQTSYLTSHTQTLSNLAPATTYHYRITITDSASNASVDTDRTFTTPAQQDTTAPVISNPMPTPSSALPTGTTSTTLGVSTDEAAQCRYATSASIAYASMPNSFTTTGLITHSTMLTGLTDGGAYSYYIRCQDGSGNVNASDYTITFSVATAGGGNLPPVLAFIADIVVVSCGAINSAALLLRSANERHPDGLANRSGLVGRNYMAHDGAVLLAVSPTRNRMVFQKTLAITDFYWGDKIYDFPLGSVQAVGRLKAEKMARHGPPVPGFFLKAIEQHSMAWFLINEDLPDPANRVVAPGGRSGE